jgi:glucose/arabinose dehydrogenase
MARRTVWGLMLTLMLSSLVPAAAQGQALPPGGTFVDDDGSPHESAIEAIFAAGATAGCGEKIFCPSFPVTRAETATFLVRALGQTGIPYQGYFKDVPNGAWYAPFVERLYQLGLIAGYPDGTFRPNNTISRADFAVMLIAAIGQKPNLPSYQGYFSDVPAGRYYTGQVERMFQLGITSGCATSPRRFCPHDQLTRAQMASFLALGFGFPLRTPPPRNLHLGLVEVASGFTQPVFLTSPPGDARLFVLDQDGEIWIIQNGAKLATPFLDIRSLVGFGGERGMLGLAFHPNYASNRKFYVNYTNTAGHTRVVEYLASPSDPNVAVAGSARTILAVNQPAGNHNGGWIGFGPDGFLYIGMGDGGGSNDTYRNAQNPNTLLGAMLRIDVNTTSGGKAYGIPSSNPFAGGGGAPEVWLTGLRNPWRNAFDGNNLYIADVGQSAWEEISLVPRTAPRANLGWPILEGKHCLSGGACTPPSFYVGPFYEYGHSRGCSITGGFVYRGSAIPDLHGAYFFADFCGGWIESIRPVGNAFTDHRSWVGDLGKAGLIFSFGRDSSGELYVMVAGGKVMKIVKA